MLPLKYEYIILSHSFEFHEETRLVTYHVY